MVRVHLGRRAQIIQIGIIISDNIADFVYRQAVQKDDLIVNDHLFEQERPQERRRVVEHYGDAVARERPPARCVQLLSQLSYIQFRVTKHQGLHITSELMLRHDVIGVLVDIRQHG